MTRSRSRTNISSMHRMPTANGWRSPGSWARCVSTSTSSTCSCSCCSCWATGNKTSRQLMRKAGHLTGLFYVSLGFVACLHANLRPQAHHRLVVLLRLVERRGVRVVLENRPQPVRLLEDGPALRRRIVLVDKADHALFLVPDPVLAVAVQKGPAHAPVLKIFLDPVGLTVLPEIQRLAGDIGFELCAVHRLCRHRGEGQAGSHGCKCQILFHGANPTQHGGSAQMTSA